MSVIGAYIAFAVPWELSLVAENINAGPKNDPEQPLPL
jgi:hypothetical protein